MAVFARSLEDDSTPAGKKAGLNAFSNTLTNFISVRLSARRHGRVRRSGDGAIF